MAAIRAAASSMPSGSPSTVSQISVTAAAVCGSWSSKSGRTARARSTNSVTASEVTPPSSDSGATVATDSPSPPSASRDVARILTVPARPRIASIAPAAALEDVLAVVDDEQHAAARASASATVSMSGTSPWGVMPSTVASAAGITRRIDRRLPVRRSTPRRGTRRPPRRRLRAPTASCRRRRRRSA